MLPITARYLIKPFTKVGAGRDAAQALHRWPDLAIGSRDSESRSFGSGPDVVKATDRLLTS